MQEVKDTKPTPPKKPLIFYYLIAMVVVMLLMGFVLGAHLFQQLIGQGDLFDGGENGLAGDLIPGGGEDGGLGIFLPQQLHGGIELFLAELLGEIGRAHV